MILLVLAGLFLLATGCTKAPEPEPIPEWIPVGETPEDALYKFWDARRESEPYKGIVSAGLQSADLIEFWNNKSMNPNITFVGNFSEAQKYSNSVLPRPDQPGSDSENQEFVYPHCLSVYEEKNESIIIFYDPGLKSCARVKIINEGWVVVEAQSLWKTHDIFDHINEFAYWTGWD